MALIKNVIEKKANFTGELVYPNAYWKVEKIMYANSKIEAEVLAYTKKDEMYIGRITTSFSPSLDGDNFVKQTYNHLKTLPEFTGATDC
jgi:hypothetical protein